MCPTIQPKFWPKKPVSQAKAGRRAKTCDPLDARGLRGCSARAYRQGSSYRAFLPMSKRRRRRFRRRGRSAADQRAASIQPVPGRRAHGHSAFLSVPPRNPSRHTRSRRASERSDQCQDRERGRERRSLDPSDGGDLDAILAATYRDGERRARRRSLDTEPRSSQERRAGDRPLALDARASACRCARSGAQIRGAQTARRSDRGCLVRIAEPPRERLLILDQRSRVRNQLDRRRQRLRDTALRRGHPVGSGAPEGQGSRPRRRARDRWK